MKPYSETLTGTKVKIPLIPIKVGTKGFPKIVKLGSPEDEEGRKDDEGPQATVELAPFWMAKLEISWDAFNEFREQYDALGPKRIVPVKGKTITEQPGWADAVSLPTPLFEQDSAPILTGMGTRGGYPVANISQFAARQFTKWLSKKTGHFYRLPTEAEWEYAARAGSTSAYHFGDDPEKLSDYAWFFDNSVYDDMDKGHPDFGAGYRKSGEKKANAWGLHDMAGNVAEWVIDAHNTDGYTHLSSEKTTKAAKAVAWPKEVFPCVARGGSWMSNPEDCRSAARLASDEELQERDPQLPKSVWWFTDGFHIGFRIVRPLVEPSEAEKLKYWDLNIADISDVLLEGGKELRVPIQPANKKDSK